MYVVYVIYIKSKNKLDYISLMGVYCSLR
jgi:hypothetical protein